MLKRIYFLEQCEWVFSVLLQNSQIIKNHMKMCVKPVVFHMLHGRENYVNGGVFFENGGEKIFCRQCSILRFCMLVWETVCRVVVCVGPTGRFWNLFAVPSWSDQEYMCKNAGFCIFCVGCLGCVGLSWSFIEIFDIGICQNQHFRIFFSFHVTFLHGSWFDSCPIYAFPLILAYFPVFLLKPAFPAQCPQSRLLLSSQGERCVVRFCYCSSLSKSC